MLLAFQTQIITYRGYTAQTFYVTTEDGYILELVFLFKH